jgi:hypothetical protein
LVTCVGVGAWLAWCKIQLSIRPGSYGQFGRRSAAWLHTCDTSLAAAFARAAPRARVSRALPRAGSRVLGFAAVSNGYAISTHPPSLPRAGSRVLGFGAASAGYAISTRPPSLPRDLPLPRDLHRCHRRDSSVPSSPSSSPSPLRSPPVSSSSLVYAELSLSPSSSPSVVKGTEV